MKSSKELHIQLVSDTEDLLIELKSGRPVNQAAFINLIILHEQLQKALIAEYYSTISAP